MFGMSSSSHLRYFPLTCVIPPSTVAFENFLNTGACAATHLYLATLAAGMAGATSTDTHPVTVKQAGNSETADLDGGS
jgi:hypothetical protein